jgi:predicted nucleotidyltransferase
LVAGVQAALGSSFVAACLQGSFAVGDFDRHSDVDFMVTIEEGLSATQVHFNG